MFPFYFHDLRTNEIVAFHAFLNGLDDSYSAEYNKTGGLGRVDKVQIYRDTTRRISLSFYVAATSKEDFNEMWYKINKLITLLYPQWSVGQRVITPSGAGQAFRMPFSQVMTSSPLIRLRVGDVLKTNYSKFNLARVFGIGEADTQVSQPDGTMTGLLDKNPDKSFGPIALGLDAAKKAQLKLSEHLFFTAFGSPLGLTNLIKDGVPDWGMRALRAAGSNLLKNGFVNPTAFLTMWRLTGPDNVENPVATSTTFAGVMDSAASNFRNGNQNLYGYRGMEIHYLKATEGRNYIRATDGTEWRVLRPLKVIIKGTIASSKKSSTLNLKSASKNSVFDKPNRGTMGGLKNTSMKQRKKLL